MNITQILFRATEDKTTGCWLLPATNGGYASRLRVDGKNVQAHRYVYEELFGPMPEGLQADHLCRVRNCVNPMHMEPVTSGENTRRGVNANREKTHCPRGHEYTPENTYISKGKTHNSRKCRICSNAKDRARYRARSNAREGGSP